MLIQDRKKLLITMGRGLLVRNFMRTDFLRTLLADETLELTILTPAFDDKIFLEEFAHERITFLDLPEPKDRKIDRWLNRIQAAMVFTSTTKIKLKRRIHTQKMLWGVYLFRWICANTFGRFRFIRNFISWLETKISSETCYMEGFDKQQLDLVFVTSLINLPDINVARIAKQRKIPLIGMCKSWDNLVKDIPVRIRPDNLLVWNEMMENQAINVQRFAPKEITKTGIPQFDCYFNEDFAISRSDYLKSLNVEENKKIICLASAGSFATSDQAIIDMILKMMHSGKLGYDCQLIIRPHFCYPDSIEWYKEFEKHSDVILQKSNNNSRLFPDTWDPKEEDSRILYQVMQHADVFLTSPSTMILDRCCFGGPAINIGFDAIDDRPGVFAMTSHYSTQYYQEVLAYKAAWFAKSEDELFTAIKSYLDTPSLHQEQRARIREDFCYLQDGKSAERIANILLTQLKQA